MPAREKKINFSGFLFGFLINRLYLWGMKPKEKKPEIVFRIIDRDSGDAVGSYSRAYCDEYDFHSVYDARHANCHGMFKDKGTYKIAKYKVVYTLIEDDCDNKIET